MEKIKFERNETKKQQSSGITLIALVVTIIILIILATVSISLVLGEHGLLKMARDGRDNYLIAANEEATVLDDLGNEIQQYLGDETSPDDNCQWIIVSDNDNSNTLSIADEVAPLNNSLKDEHFVVINISNNRVTLLSKLCVDPTANSQMTNADGVTYEEGHATPVWGEHWCVPSGGTVGTVLIPVTGTSADEYYTEQGLVPERIYSSDVFVVYNYTGREDNIVKVVGNGRCIENYEQRFTEAGMTLDNIAPDCKMRMAEKEDLNDVITNLPSGISFWNILGDTDVAWWICTDAHYLNESEGKIRYCISNGNFQNDYCTTYKRFTTNDKS